jgi:hypothetical protein
VHLCEDGFVLVRICARINFASRDLYFVPLWICERMDLWKDGFVEGWICGRMDLCHDGYSRMLVQRYTRMNL